MFPKRCAGSVARVTRMLLLGPSFAHGADRDLTQCSVIRNASLALGANVNGVLTPREA